MYLHTTGMNHLQMDAGASRPFKLNQRGNINLHFLADAFICTQLLMLRGTQSDVYICKAHACESNLQDTFYVLTYT